MKLATNQPVPSHRSNSALERSEVRTPLNFAATAPLSIRQPVRSEIRFFSPLTPTIQTVRLTRSEV